VTRPRTSRPQHRPPADPTPAAPSRWRLAALVAIVVGVLGAGLFLGFGDFFNRPTGGGGTISMQISMAGFAPQALEAAPGQTLTIDWWNQDNAMHLQNGVHTLVSDQLGIHDSLPAESHKTITITAPASPGDYDFWCDSCCGGKESPTMHGTLRVRAA
jgi:plastocyanin